MIRSRAKYYEQGEKNTNYFLGLEKKNQSQKCMCSLINDEGNLIENRNEILKEQAKFYTKLYTSKNSFDTSSDQEKKTFFNDTHQINRLDEDEKQSCEGEITIEECEKVIKTMKNNKSPGVDGLPCEFYKVFWLDMKDIFVRSINTNYQNGKMSNSQRQSVIALIPKKDKDIRYLKNWRPISLLNTDYKIAAKVIAQRISRHLPKIISVEQTGFIKNRYIGENIRTIIDIIDYVENSEEPGLIFSIDFEKAFDCIDWNYMYNCLSYFGFGDGFISWIKTFYTDISSRTINNGWTSAPFSVSRGVRQGCPLSPYLFIICGEPLTNAIKNSPNIRGINIDNNEFLITQFADDTQLFLEGTEKSLNSAISLLENFAHCSGLKINFEKSECYKIGSIRNNNRTIKTYKTIKWSKGPINVLGIKIPITNRDDIFKLNIQDKLTNIKSTFNLWNTRNLTLIGKINIIKSQILSKLTYILTVLPIFPKHYLEEIQRMIYCFIWNGKTDRIQRQILINSIEEGGLKTPDLETYEKSLKLTWIKRYIDENNSGLWKYFLAKIMNNFGNIFLLSCNMDPNDEKISRVKNKFYKDILQTWFELNKIYNNEERIEPSQEFIWNNRNIKIMNATIFYKEWYENGIIHVADLFQNGNLISYNTLTNIYHIETNFIKYFSICSAIPREWKNKIKISGQTRPYNITSKVFSILSEHKKISRIFYWKLLQRKCKTPERIIRYWTQCFPELRKNDFKVFFRTALSCTVEAKIVSFQFKFLHNILPNNKLLYKMGKRESENCHFCKTEPDSLQHMFWGCKTVSEFYSKIENHLKDRLGQNFLLEKKEIFLGKNMYIRDNKTEFMNHLYLLLKCYIFTCFIKETVPLDIAFINKILITEETERYIANRKGALEKHAQKWGIYFS